MATFNLQGFEYLLITFIIFIFGRVFQKIVTLKIENPPTIIANKNEIISEQAVGPLEKLTNIEKLSGLDEIRCLEPDCKELLKAAGFDNIYKLVESETDDLYEKVVAANNRFMFMSQTPSKSRITCWQECAKILLAEFQNSIHSPLNA